jgi:aspartyl-tRNA(Asn)/glutamyl-tRNA(Gln) amidotransferase subunit A
MPDPSTTPTRPLHTLHASEMTQGFREGSLQPEAVTAALLDAIAADRHDINAFTGVDRAAAMAQAHASAARWRDGLPLGPLDGVPVSVKDLSPMAGWRTGRGSLACANEPVATQDAIAVQRLREGGAVLFGKTTTTEFGWSIGSESPASGVTRNPHDLSRSAGGSSSGAAAQVAMGWGPVALGSDAGGSVRVPAAYCGLVSIKPTFGWIAQQPQSAFTDLAHLGPLTRSVEDCRTAFSVLSGPDARDPASVFARLPLGTPGRKPRIGWALRFGNQPLLEPAIERAMLVLVDRLQREGYDVQEVPMDWFGCHDESWRLWAWRIHESFFEWSDAQRALLDPRLQRLYHYGAAQTAETLTRCKARLREATVRMAGVFSQFDFLLTPTSPVVAPPNGRLTPPAHPQAQVIENETSNWFAINPYTYLFNVTQQPAMSLPLGKDAAGLPFGLQVVARKYDDLALLDLALDLEPLLITGGGFAPASASTLATSSL